MKTEGIIGVAVAMLVAVVVIIILGFYLTKQSNEKATKATDRKAQDQTTTPDVDSDTQDSEPSDSVVDTVIYDPASEQ